MSQGITYNIPDFVLKTLLVCLKNLDWLDYISEHLKVEVDQSECQFVSALLKLFQTIDPDVSQKVYKHKRKYL